MYDKETYYQMNYEACEKIEEGDEVIMPLPFIIGGIALAARSSRG